MKIFLSKPRGFCAGVVRAIDTVEQALKLWGPPIYVKHEIVHNRHVVEDLRQKGAVFIEDLDEVPLGARIIYSAHGVSPAVREQAKARNLIEIDATCGLVTKVHSAVKRFAQKGYQIVLIGHRTHVEIVGTAGEAPEVTTVVESVEDVEKLTFSPEQKLFYTTQTTLSLDDVNGITEALLRKYPQIETLPSSSICYATTNRQMALKAIANQVDLVLVIGDLLSSNSNRLREVAEKATAHKVEVDHFGARPRSRKVCEECISKALWTTSKICESDGRSPKGSPQLYEQLPKKRGVPAHLINHPDEIDLNWLKGVENIGMSAGASTPEEVVQNCIEFLRLHGVNQVEEVVYTEEDIFFQLPKQVLGASP